MHQFEIYDAIERNLKTNEFTPVQRIGENNWIKREDLYEIFGARGGKSRSCYEICKQGLEDGFKGFVTAGSKQSPQIQIVSFLAKEWGVPFKAHCPEGTLSEELKIAIANGAQVFQHKAGYNNVIKARARQDAEETGYLYIPFGMECFEAVYQTATQVGNLVDVPFKRLVMPVGSGMSISGVLWGLEYFGLDTKIEVLGVSVGAKYEKILDEYAPVSWRDEKYVKIIKSPFKYHDYYKNNVFGDVVIDPIYEAKCLDYIQDGDLLWSVGIRYGLN